MIRALWAFCSATTMSKASLTILVVVVFCDLNFATLTLVLSFGNVVSQPGRNLPDASESSFGHTESTNFLSSFCAKACELLASMGHSTSWKHLPRQPARPLRKAVCTAPQGMAGRIASANSYEPSGQNYETHERPVHQREISIYLTTGPRKLHTDP